MCGRYTHKLTWKQIHYLLSPHGRDRPEMPESFGAVPGAPAKLPLPRFNVAPTQTAPVVLQEDGARRLESYRWGLVPHWAKDLSVGAKAINARSETVATLPMFRSAFKSRRCLVPASGFYEWQTLDSKRKQPWYFSPPDADEVWAFAGLWESWSGPDGEVRSYTIVTMPANDAVAPVHDRMPAVLPPESWGTWLDPATEDPARLIEPLPAELTGAHRVSSRVNRPAHDDESLIAPCDADPDTGGLWS